jgi:hypothetical protein
MMMNVSQEAGPMGFQETPAVVKARPGGAGQRQQKLLPDRFRCRVLLCPKGSCQWGKAVRELVKNRPTQPHLPTARTG